MATQRGDYFQEAGDHVVFFDFYIENLVLDFTLTDKV